jgi:hypothetical protein
VNVFLALRILYIATLVVVTAFALRHGGRSERAGALIILVGSALSMAIQQSPFFDWRFARGGLVAVDLVVLAAFIALALRSQRFWPLWATAFHLIAVTSHLLMFFEPRRILQAYAIAQGFWAYPMLVLIASASWLRRRRIRWRLSRQSGGT